MQACYPNPPQSNTQQPGKSEGWQHGCGFDQEQNRSDDQTRERRCWRANNGINHVLNNSRRPGSIPELTWNFGSPLLETERSL